jgi:DNA-binding NarL/FixJ family response regulator
MLKTGRRIRVLLADDQRIMREGLRKLLEAEDDFEVVGEVANGREAVAKTQQLRPAVVLMDIGMPLLNGLEAARQIRQSVPDAKVLVLSAHSEDAYVQRAMASGAAGYLSKQTSGAVLANVIRAVAGGKVCYSPPVGQRLRQRDAQARSGEAWSGGAFARLSSREVSVLQLIAEGEANKQVAANLGICVKTVEKHRANLRRKLDIHDTASLTRYAMGAGIIESYDMVKMM